MKSPSKNSWSAALALALFLGFAIESAPARSMAVTSSLTRAEAVSAERIDGSSGTVATAKSPPPAPPVIAPIVKPKPTRVARASRMSDFEYNVIKIASFESKEERNDYDGGYLGVWNRDPDDETQGCTLTFTEPGLNDAGTCLELDYDVDAFHEAYNGLWVLFVDLDLTAYSNLCFWARGDKQAGFTTRFVAELKSEDEAGRTSIEGITPDWQLFTIPLTDFGGIRNWTKMTEFVISFEDKDVTKKTGKIYIDNIYFETARPKGTVEMADPRLSDDEAAHAPTHLTDSPPPRSPVIHPNPTR